MTTVAYDGKTIAYDSLTVCDRTIVDDNAEKRHSVNGCEYFLYGATSEHDLFIRAHQGESVQIHKSCSVGGIIVQDGKVSTAGMTAEEGFFVNDTRQDNVLACGSGADHAITAMDMGADAKTAVKMAAKRDTNTGGRIRTYKVST